MSTRTRQWMLWCVVLVAVTVPPELLILDAATSRSAAESWVSHMTVTERGGAASHIQSYSAEYRRALLKVMPPEAKSAVWRGVISDYIAAHPRLTSGQMSLLGQAADLASPKTFANPTDQDRKEVGRLMQVLADSLGAVDARSLLLTAGPEDKAPRQYLASLPLRTRLQSAIREHFVVFASNCNCQSTYNDCSSGFFCSELQGCGFEYTGCGVWGFQYCNGYCLPNPPLD